MLNPKAFANAVSIITAVWFVGCWLLSLLIPDLIFNIGQSWMHTINLSAVKTTLTLDPGSFIVGLVTLVGLTWVTTYATIVLYNKWAK